MGTRENDLDKKSEGSQSDNYHEEILFYDTTKVKYERSGTTYG